MRLRLILPLTGLLVLTGCCATPDSSGGPTAPVASPETPETAPLAVYSSVTGRAEIGSEQLLDMFTRHLGDDFSAIYLGDYSDRRMYLGTGDGWACIGSYRGTQAGSGCDRIRTIADAPLMMRSWTPDEQPIVAAPDGFATVAVEGARCQVHRNAVVVIDSVEDAHIEMSGDAWPTVELTEGGATTGDARCFATRT